MLMLVNLLLHERGVLAIGFPAAVLLGLAVLVDVLVEARELGQAFVEVFHGESLLIRSISSKLLPDLYRLH